MVCKLLTRILFALRKITSSCTTAWTRLSRSPSSTFRSRRVSADASKSYPTSPALSKRRQISAPTTFYASPLRYSMRFVGHVNSKRDLLSYNRASVSMHGLPRHLERGVIRDKTRCLRLQDGLIPDRSLSCSVRVFEVLEETWGCRTLTAATNPESANDRGNTREPRTILGHRFV